jgi:DNA repair ATPase RecN
MIDKETCNKLLDMSMEEMDEYIKELEINPDSLEEIESDMKVINDLLGE